ncbi:MAG: tRNA adenosine(34) deaminase TadA [Verrucomicrobiales bacterium]|jgi:tRNA(adenine34) deaminase|nr:tRNA adenosine(34) deaminase TadA [Verrucomicrobiales bacterium]
MFNDEYFMREALRLARKAAADGEVPIGAVIVRGHEIIGRAWNQVELLKDATAHAEMLALTQAQTAVGDWRLNECSLFVTKEPCPMCAGASVLCRVGRVVIGANDPKYGAAGGSVNLLQFDGWNHRCDIVSGVLEPECRALLREFFRERRKQNAESQRREAAAEDF